MIDAARKPRSGRRRSDARVVAGRDGVAAELLRVLPQLSELEPVVAADAGIRRAPGVVLVLEVADDPAEVVAEVHDVEGNAEPRRDEPRIGRVVDRAASLVADLRPWRARRARRIRDRGLELLAGATQAHEAADHLVALALKQGCGDRAVDAAGHGEQNFHGWESTVARCAALGAKTNNPG